MQEKVNLNKEVYNRGAYEKVIDTSFSQLGTSNSEPIQVQEVSVDEFFLLYDRLFFDIPQRGNNSHETLITTSTEYIGYNPLTTEIEALQEEITELRRQLLEERTSAVNTIADVLDESGLNLPALPELPDLDVPSEFTVDISGGDNTGNSDQGEEQSRREKRKESREKRRERRRDRRESRRERRNRQ